MQSSQEMGLLVQYQKFRHETAANMASVVNMYISGKKSDNIKIYELNIIKQKYVISAMEYIKN